MRKTLTVLVTLAIVLTGCRPIAFRMPPEPAPYRLTLEQKGVEGTPSRWAAVRTSWEFKSERVTDDEMPNTAGHLCVENYVKKQGIPVVPGACSAEPLIFLAYDIGETLSLENTLAAPGVHRFRVTAHRQPSPAGHPEIAGLSFWVSVDDGRNWKPATVIPRGQAGTDGRLFDVIAPYPHPRSTSGAVSLKASAWDRDGNRVEQVIDRAFKLVPHGGRS